MSEELVSILLWIEVDPIRITVLFFIFRNIFLLTLVPVLLTLLTWAIVGVSLRHSTTWLVLESFDVDGFDQLILLSEWNLWGLIEDIVYTHVVIVKQIKVDCILLDECAK